jgi:CubicO group peptidase (beta-lactamase class C family)
MTSSIRRLSVAATFAGAVAVTAHLFAQATMTEPAADVQIDKIFSRWNQTTPGCAVGVAMAGKPVLNKAYGMADLEREVRNTAETIFEAGSVSKQFTAAAVLLLAREGKLSLDDPARKYITELPDYGTPPTIRHMLNHTSGLRDWGSLEGIAGWPRTSRVYQHAHVVDILGRQRALNFPPGTRWSYSNSGYNLAAVIVSRVSGMPFAEFTRARIFQPLGMTHTSWRDDHTRVVKNRAIAYDDRKDGFHTEMPFENVHGNGGLLTTVGDLLRWNENFTLPRVGDASFVAEQQQAGKFTDGRPHGYALGLRLGPYKGVTQVEHSGSTAGYRAHLARYPEQRVSVAVLCNASSAQATQYAHAVADVYLGQSLRPDAAPKASNSLTDSDLTRLAGVYRNVARGLPTTIVRDGNGLRVQNGPALIPTSAMHMVAVNGSTWEFDGQRRVRVTDDEGTVDTLERVEAAAPTIEQLRPLAGIYASDEIETTLTVEVNGDTLVVKRRPDTVIKLTPVYADAFSGASLGLVIFRRDNGGHVDALSVIQDRVWDLRFARQAAMTASAP